MLTKRIKLYLFVFLLGIVYFLLPRAFVFYGDVELYRGPLVSVEKWIYRAEKHNFLFTDWDRLKTSDGDVLIVDERSSSSWWEFYTSILSVEIKHKMKILKGERADFLYKDESWFLERYKQKIGDSEAVTKLSEFYRYSGDYEKAEKVLVDYLSAHPNNDEVLVSLGFLSTTTGRLDKGSEYLKKAIIANPENQSAYIAHGKVYRNQGKHEEAQREFDKAKVINPNDSAVFFYEGYNYLDRGFYELAEESFKRMEGDSEVAPSLVGLADVYSRKRNYSKAEEFYLKAMRTDPTLEMPYLGLGFMYIEMGKYKRAEQILNLALDLNVKSDVLSALGILFQNKGEYEKAIDSFGKAVLLDESYVEGYMNLARTYHLMGDFESAVYNAKKRLKYPNNEEALVFLGEVYKSAGKNQEALEYWRKSRSWQGAKLLIENGLTEDIEGNLGIIAGESDLNDDAARFLANYYFNVGDMEKYRMFDSKVESSLEERFWKGLLDSSVINKVKVVKVLVNTKNEKRQIEGFISGSGLSEENKRKIIFSN